MCYVKHRFTCLAPTCSTLASVLSLWHPCNPVALFPDTDRQLRPSSEVCWASLSPTITHTPSSPSACSQPAALVSGASQPADKYQHSTPTLSAGFLTSQPHRPLTSHASRPHAQRLPPPPVEARYQAGASRQQRRPGNRG